MPERIANKIILAEDLEQQNLVRRYLERCGHAAPFRLLPLTRRRPNALFHYVFVFFYAVSYMQHTRIGLARLAREGLHWFRLFLAERRD